VRRLAALSAVAIVAAGCGGIDSEDLLIPRPKTIDRGTVFAIVEQMGREARGGNPGERQDEMLAEATDGQRAVYRLFAFDYEINNGGFEQLFFNSTGDWYHLAIGDARRIDATEQHRILREAERGVGGVSVDRETRQRLVELLSPITTARLDELADEWVEAVPQLYAKLVGYIRAHPDQFFRD
jgi:hypothetical protein